MSLLDIEAPWLQAPPLPEGTHERYDEFDASDTTASLWEHGTRALECAWGRRGARGLPLMGTGDWNDGMDRVGQGGRGESVWMAWFLIRTLDAWRSLAIRRRDDATVERCTRRIHELTGAVERHAWDGEWYRRAFFDDGSLLGSSQAPEARIDSIAQSWATLSGVADPERARIALDSAGRWLVQPEAGLALLLTPPFDGAGPHPGYIAAYPPGVRENGGQYTHAAAWLLSAFARSGDGEQAGGILRRILPSWHAAGDEGTRRYRVEPYVVAADIYGAEPHVGRGGWTWYTGSAGWIFRVVFEDILGIRREGDHVRIDPCIPPDWPACEVGWKVGGGKLRLRILNPAGVSRGIVRCTVDGVDADPARIPVPVSGVIEVEVELGAPADP
jgi:cyclic beta-1,2-glucan synthetase